ncbi:cytochrome P450 [Corynascus similis CBS 632.67]
MEPVFLIFLISIVVFSLIKLGRIGRRPKGCPPGPPTLPILGNLHQIPKKDAHVQFKKWAEEYGPVYSLVLGTTVNIVLSSGIYSSRPEAYISSLASDGRRMVLMEYGNKWRLIRKFFHAFLQLKAVKAYVPYIELESASIMVDLLDEPHLVFDHIRRYTNSIATQMVYGFRTSKIDDPQLLSMYDTIEKWGEITGAGAAALLDVFPVLRALPPAIRPLYQYALSIRKASLDLAWDLWQDVKRKIREGNAKSCFCVGLADAQAKEPELEVDDMDLAMVASTGLEAASDTTANTLAGFIQGIFLYPDAQRAAQAAIDRVCGDRYPTMADMDHPDAQYIRACVKETLRWMPTAVLGVPHAVTRDDEYMGYKIPNGATVVLNIWGIHRDEARYRNPSAFDPSRYMDDLTTSSESAQSPDPTKRDHYSFGAGRRICEGMHAVDRTMFLFIARLMWAFDLSPAKDADGQDIIPKQDDLQGNFLRQPRRFPLKITPRSDLRAATVRKAWAECQKLLDDDKQWKETPEGMPFTL